MFLRIEGVTGSSIAIGPTGPSVQNDPANALVQGAVGVYTNLGFPYYANLRAADPITDQDVVTLGYLQKLVGAPEEERGLFDGAPKEGGLYG